MKSHIYKISLFLPQEHLFEVRHIFPANERSETIVALPAWIPGSYLVRDFARNIIEFSASTDGERCDWEKLSKNHWQINHGSGEKVELRYLVYAFDRSVRSAHLDNEHAYFNGTSMFIRPVDSDADYEVELIRPGQADFSSWQVYTGMPAVEIDERGFGRYRADSYQELVDYPVEIGMGNTVMFPLNDVLHRFVVSGRHYGDLQQVVDDVKKACNIHCEMFGELPCKDQYLFLLQLLGNGYGGLEHRNSTSLICSRTDIENSDSEKPSEGYRQLIALCSHEYFHLWNGKRIRPERHHSPSLDHEIHTDLLWMIEGITSYYDELALVRSGVINELSYLEMLAQNLTRYFKGKGRYRQSVAESSFDTWTKFYQQDENAPNAIVSYYTKGGIAVMMLDFALRAQSCGEHNFDDVMRHLWRHYGKPDVGVPEDAMPGIIEAATGIDLSDLITRLIYSTDSIDELLQQQLKELGIALRLRPPVKQQEKGASLKEPPSDPEGIPWLGANSKAHDLGVQLTHIFSGGPTAKAGLSVGDILIALDGYKLEFSGLDDALRRIANRSEVVIHYFRGDELHRSQLTIEQGEPYVAELWIDPDGGEAEHQARKQWLHLS